MSSTGFDELTKKLKTKGTVLELKDIQKLRDKVEFSGFGFGRENIECHRPEEVVKHMYTPEFVHSVLSINLEYPHNVDLWFPALIDVQVKDPSYSEGLHFRMSLQEFEDFLNDEDKGVAKVYRLLSTLRDVFVDNDVILSNESTDPEKYCKLFLNIKAHWISRVIAVAGDILREYYDLSRNPRAIRVKKDIIQTIMGRLCAKRPNCFERQISGGNYVEGHRIWILPIDKKDGSDKVSEISENGMREAVYEKPQLVLTTSKGTHTAIVGLKVGATIFYGEVDADTVQDLFVEWSKLNWSNDRFIAEILKSSVRMETNRESLSISFEDKYSKECIAVEVDYPDRLSNLLETIIYRMEKEESPFLICEELISDTVENW